MRERTEAYQRQTDAEQEYYDTDQTPKDKKCRLRAGFLFHMVLSALFAPRGRELFCADFVGAIQPMSSFYY